jgi:hypothetical protein
MIKEKEVSINITKRNITFYKKLGYNIDNVNIPINIKIVDINKNSKIKITAICDICGEEKTTSIYNYYDNVKRGGYYGCRKCSNKKYKKTCKDKYGVNTTLKTENVKNKIINKNINKKIESKEKLSIKEKEVSINITMRNVSYYKSLGYEINKINQSIMVNVEDVAKNSHVNVTAICEKCDKETEIRLHKFHENKERGGYYGCRKCSRKKFKKTCLDKFGVDNPMKNEEVKNKTYNTNLERYGVKTTLQSKECNPLFYTSTSNKEINLLNFIKENYNGVIIASDRNTLDGLELDIYLPDEKLAIEFNGLYWHNDINKTDRNYHLNKTKKCEKEGIDLIHIFEDEYIYQLDVIKSIILNKLHLTKNKIYGRKTILKEIETKDAKDFLNKNHIQGYTSSSVKIGLYYKDELVSVMLFSKKSVGGRISFDGYELSRFANKLNTNVIGGANKILKYFEKKYKPKEIRSYADRRWFNGKIYKIMGFEQTHINPVSYWYVIGDKRKHKSLFTKQKIEKQGFDINGKTANQIMKERKIYRIYDCGTISFSKKYEHTNY